jgi:preprotein translocase subunit SecE
MANERELMKAERAKLKAERQAKQQKRKNAQVANRNKLKNDEKKGGLGAYFKGVRVETKKVVWPTRKELVSYTIVVIFTCAVIGTAIWGIDSGFLALLKALFNINM